MQEQKERLEFSKTVVEKGGFAFLLHFFTKIDKLDLDKSTLRCKVLTLLLKIIPHFFNKNLLTLVSADIEKAIDKLL